MSLVNLLIEKYNFPLSNSIIPSDMVNLYSDFPKYQSCLKNLLKSEQKLQSIEKYIIDLETNPLRYLAYLISQTYLSNYYIDVYTVLTNIDNLCSKNNKSFLDKFERLYKNRIQILDISKHIIGIFDTLINRTYPMSDKYDLIRFFSLESIEKFIKCLDFEKPNYNNIDDTMTRYKARKIWYKYFYPSVQTVKNYLLFNIQNNSALFETSTYGLSGFDPELYLYFIEYNTGLKLNNVSELEYLYQWAEEYLKLNIQSKINTIKNIYPDLKTSKTSDISNINTYKTLQNRIMSDPTYNFESLDEIIQTYTKAVNNLHNEMISKSVPITNKCKVMKFNDPNMSGAYYIDDCFYLNISNWSNLKKYEVRTLTMHEAYPGHHMQIDISKHKSPNGYLANVFQPIFNSFTEGWGLFAESLHTDNDESSNFGQLDANTLRIFRIIADIDLHYKKKSVKDTIIKASDYLAMDKNGISSEINRYMIYPAQALSYKIGEIAYMAIYLELSKKYQTLDITDPRIFNEFVQILINGEKPLNELLNKYNLVKSF
jgi:hypothetical protein